MNKLGCLIRYFLVVIWITLLAGQAGASVNSVALTAEGRSILSNNGNPTHESLLGGHAKFEAAVVDDPTDAAANFFYGMTRLAVFSVEENQAPGLDTLQDFFIAFGVNPEWYVESGDDPFEQLPYLYEEYDPPATVPDGATAQTFFAGPLLTELNGALANFDVPGSSFAVTLSGEETGGGSIEIDYGDVLALRATLLFLKTGILIGSAYNLDLDLREFFAIVNSNVFNLQRLLDEYPDLLSLRPGAGSSALADAAVSLDAAIDSIRAAYQFISAEADDQADDLLIFGSAAEESYARHILSELTELQVSLAENRPAVFSSTPVYMMLTDDATGDTLSINMDLNGAGVLIDGTATAGSNCDFIFCSSAVTDYVNDNGQVTITLDTEGFCPGTATLNATLSGDQITGGTFTATDCWHAWGGGVTFSGSVFTFPPETETYDFNYVFGNGAKAPLDVRAVLPKFGVFEDPVSGTFPGDPILNGITVDFPDNKSLAAKLKLLAATDAGTAYFNIPQVADGAITLDGNPTDWAAQTGVGVFTDYTEDIKVLGPEGVDIRGVYLAKDSTHLYIGFELADGAPFAQEGINFVVETTHRPGYSQTAGNLLAGAIYTGGQWWAQTAMRQWPGGPPIEIGTATNDVGTGADFIEWRVPLTTFANLSGRWLNAYSQQAWPGGSIVFDEAYTQIKLDTATLSGSITCSSCSGDGKFFVQVQYGPDPNITSSVAGTYLDAAGSYSLDGVPYMPGAYLFVHYDTDNNGIKSFGDRWGVSGPIPVTAGGAIASVDVTEVFDDSWMKTKPGVFRVFGSNAYTMPEFYFGPWNPNEVFWGPEWTFLGEFNNSVKINTEQYYKYFLIMWNSDRQFAFDSIEDLTAGTAFRTDESGAFVNSRWIVAQLTNLGDEGWSEPDNFVGRMNGTYAVTGSDPGFVLLEMPDDSFAPATPRQIAIALQPAAGDINGDGEVDMMDVILAIKIVCGFDTSSEDVFVGATVDTDGTVGIKEMIHVLQEIAGIRSSQ